MRPGDFSTLAQSYAHRPAYSENVIDALATLVLGARATAVVADVGAGTGKLTAMLDARGLSGCAVEPNGPMRAEGEALRLSRFQWRAGAAEATGLESESVDWATMASAFHWAEPIAALTEFHRILKPGGALTILYNPRDLERDATQARIEARIAAIAPHVRRRSSGAAPYTQALEETLLAGGLFVRPLQIEAPHTEHMSRARHLGAWRSVNDLRAQVGPETFEEILAAIGEELGDAAEIEVRYRTRTWTVWKA